MRILLVGATAMEIPDIFDRHCNIGVQFEKLITGVGMTATALALGAKLSTDVFDGILNVGVAGSFKANLPHGRIVRVIEDTFIELGAEDHERFISIDELGLGRARFTEAPYLSTNKALNSICKVSAITVNTVHGNSKSIHRLFSRIQPDIETMEGAAVFQAANTFNIPCLQVRAISNYVEPRNKKNWNIPLALDSLESWCKNFLLEFNNS